MRAKKRSEWTWGRRSLLAGMIGAASATSIRAEDEYTLLFDLRVHGTGSKTAEVKAAGDIVLMDMFVLLRGSNALKLDDKLQLGSGGFASSTGGLLGDLLALPSAAPFNAAGTSPGTQIDLDEDGDLDIGVRPWPASQAYWGFRSASPVGNMPEGGFHVGQIQFTVTSIIGQPTQIGFFLQPESRYSALYFIDNVMCNGGDPGVRIGAPVTIAYGGPPIVLPGETQYLSGSIDQHVSVQGVVKPAAATVLTLTRGLDVAAGGVFDAPGPHEVHVEDATSGNAGGTLRVGRMMVGKSGTGDFAQTGGLTQVDYEISLGQDRNSSGTLRATGGTLMAGAMRIGEYGAGTFIQSGGHSTLGRLDVGLYENAGAVVEVNGTGQLAVADEARIGVFGPGVFRQKGGSTSLGNAVIGYGGGSANNAPAVGMLEITGGRIAANRLSVGGQGRGEVTQSGGQADFQNLRIGTIYGAAAEAPNSYTLTAGTLSTSILTLGENGNGVFIQSGGTFANSGTTVIRTLGETARFELRDGDYSVSRQLLGSDLRSDDQRYRGQFLQTGGRHTVDFFQIGRNGHFQYSGGSFRVNQLLESQGQIDFGGGAVTLEVGDGAFVDFAKSTLSNTARAAIVAGKNSLLNFAAGFDPQTAFVSVQTQGLIHIDGQPLAVPADNALCGSGTITGDISNSGTISPGHSPGKLTVVGDYLQETRGLLHIEIAGTAEDQFDVLAISGEAILDGQLTVELLGQYIPSPTDEFVIVAAESLSGRFANAWETVNVDGGRFNVVYSANAVTLTGFTPIPEPACLAILVLPALLLPRRCRHR